MRRHPQLDIQDGGHTPPSSPASELLSDLAAIIDDEARQGIDRLGERAVTRLASEWGGQQLYIPIDRARRNNQIYSLFDGSNLSWLARRFHLSDSAIRRILAAERARRRNIQLTFF